MTPEPPRSTIGYRRARWRLPSPVADGSRAPPTAGNSLTLTARIAAREPATRELASTHGRREGPELVRLRGFMDARGLPGAVHVITDLDGTAL